MSDQTKRPSRRGQRKFIRPETERFWEKVDKTAECWMWIGAANHGYGVFWSRSRQRQVYVHRWAYEELVGPIPDGLFLDHLCLTKRCVNPAHLEPVTGLENSRRAAAAGLYLSQVCRNGHEFTPENTITEKRGNRRCRTCARASNVRGEAKRREKRRQAKRDTQWDFESGNPREGW